MLQTDDDLRALFDRTQRIALVGASKKPERPSNEVMAFLLASGFEVVPVNPGFAGEMLMGQMTYASLSDIPGPIDMVDVFREKSALPAITDEAIAIGAKSLWFQLDLVDHDCATRAEAAGLDMVMNRCPAIDIPRLNWHRNTHPK